MKKAKYIIFRYLTSADWFNIYKPSGTEIGGGGQSYIDFPTNEISIDEWGDFFDGAENVYCDTGKQGPVWTFPVRSIGSQSEQDIKIYQRRQQSVCIASQKLTSRDQNRVGAWRPENGFPAPDAPAERSTVPSGLIVFLVRSEDNNFFAGWTQSFLNSEDARISELFSDIFKNVQGEGFAGFYQFKENIVIDPSNTKAPFRLLS